ncbi:MAG: DUF86 domain-containing protein [Synechococcales bacterium]|nr:DUF86 domain-containing protein [Synechococcales bacterium]
MQPTERSIAIQNPTLQVLTHELGQECQKDPERDNLDYLNDILERLQRIRTFAQNGETAFLESSMIQDAIIWNFEVMGEATKQLTTEFRQQYPQVAWKKMAGFQDVLIHNYVEIRLDEVWKAIETELPPLETQLLEILQELKHQS